MIGDIAVKLWRDARMTFYVKEGIAWCNIGPGRARVPSRPLDLT